MATRATTDTLKAGDYIRCNDPRYGWTVKVIGIGPFAGVYKANVKLPNGRYANIKLDRIFTDGNVRHQGYNLVMNSDSASF